MSSKVMIYQDANYSGSSQELSEGSYDISDLKIGNDKLSSLRVPNGFKVTLYEHGGFSGRSQSFITDTPWVGDFNDITSGIRVERLLSNIQAGSIKLNSPGPLETKNGDTSTFTTVTFPTPFPEGSNVIVIPMVQTFNGADTPGIRIADVTTTGFKFRMNELVRGGPREALSDGNHTTETIGWIAVCV